MNLGHRLRRLEQEIPVGDAPDRPCRVCANGTKNRTIKFEMNGVIQHDPPVPPCRGCGRENVVLIRILPVEAMPGYLPPSGT
jgi:hypothetical protein